MLGYECHGDLSRFGKHDFGGQVLPVDGTAAAIANVYHSRARSAANGEGRWPSVVFAKDLEGRLSSS
jgi:hypothetical protein